MTETASGTGYGHICKSNYGATMALRAACNRISKTDNTAAALSVVWNRISGRLHSLQNMAKQTSPSLTDPLQLGFYRAFGDILVMSADNTYSSHSPLTIDIKIETNGKNII